ncbi:MAG: antibiotic biosynthesis monooxygenase [bacterium]|nr:antibiotic biosynthesis monooxygenase [bacterium]MDE0353243.1 antibiotic biosynthesis monooxygenase [bacterium]
MRTITVQATIRQDHLERFLTASIANARASVATEPGCRRFDIFGDDTDPARVGFNEIYDDDGAVEAHGESAHFAAWFAATDGMADQLVWATCRSLDSTAKARRDATGERSEDPPSTGGMVVYQARISVRPEDTDGFIGSVTEQARAAAAAEQGLLRFDINQNLDIATEFWLYRVHTDGAAAGDHAAAPYTAAHLDRYGGYYSDGAPRPISGPNIWPPDTGW